MQCGRSRSFSQQNVNCPAAAVAPSGGRVGHNVTAHPPGAQPPLDVFLQNSLILLRVPATAVNDADTSKTSSQRFKQEFFENKTRFLLVEAVQVQMGLDREPA